MIGIVILLIISILLFSEMLRSQTGDIVKSTVLAISKFVVLFCLSSFGCFAINQFRYRNALLLELVICSFYLLTVYLHVNRHLTFSFEWRSLWIPLLVVCITIPFTAQKAEYFGMGQDEGVYQTEAIVLASGHTNLYNSFSEINSLESEDEKDAYIRMLDEQGGFYRLNKTLSMDEYANKSSPYPIKNDTTGTFHGLHIFSALLGLWVKLFGLSNMLGIITLIYFCSIFMFYYTIQNICRNNLKLLISTTAFAFSPIVLWISKTTYSESMVLLSLVLYLYYLTASSKKTADIISIGISTIYIACMHIMFLVFYPVFWFVNVLISSEEDRKAYMINNIIMAVGTIAVYYVYSRISIYYFFYNLARLYMGSLITIDNIVWWISAGALISVPVGMIISMALRKNGTDKAYKTIICACKCLVFICAAYTGYHFYKIGAGIVEQDFYNSMMLWGTGAEAFFGSSLCAIVCYTGLLFPISIIMLLRIKTGNTSKSMGIAILVIYTWFVFLYAGVMKSEIWYYLYYSRYLAYVIPVIILFFVYHFTKPEITEKTKKWLSAAVIISLALMMIIDIPLAINKDDTYAEWTVIKALSSQIEEKCALIIDDPIQKQYLFAIKTLTNTSIYPKSNNLYEQSEKLRKTHNRVYYLKKENEQGADEFTKEQWGTVVRLNYESSINRLVFVGGVNIENYKSDEEITLYEFKQNSQI